ncbi:MAG: hypothetical protein Q9226_009297 [Calogaya cf. arnoldii]
MYTNQATRGLTSDRFHPPIFDNITIHDPIDKTWYAQTATGQIPTGRLEACSVGVKGDQGTYEVFLYGGHNILERNISVSLLDQFDQSDALDEVYVLSLPAFAWFKADYPARQSRTGHTCNLVGKGNRQMLSIGGKNPTDILVNATNTDPFLQGLGVFDLTAMRWSDRYNADAESYETPAVVKAWYAVNGRSTRNWDSPAVQRLFLQDTSGRGEADTPPPSPER